jgi:hypothetical protein
MTCINSSSTVLSANNIVGVDFHKPSDSKTPQTNYWVGKFSDQYTFLKQFSGFPWS